MNFKDLDRRSLVGGLLVLIVGIFAVVSAWNNFLIAYPELKVGYKAVNNLPAVKIVTWLLPVMSDFIMVAGVALVVAAYGFFTKRNWAMKLSLISIVVGLAGSWMAIVWPLMIAFPLRYLPLFLVFIATWSILLLYVKQENLKITALSTFGGIAMILNIMSGTASLNKLMGTLYMNGTPMPLFVMTQQLNWIVAVGWGIFTMGVIYRKSWVLLLGIIGGIFPLMVATPLAYMDSVNTGETSMFWISPIVSGALLIILLVTGDKLWMSKTKEIEAKASVSA
ncbi:MAG: hypothetical protein AB7V16_04950 [Vulcanibacillus sp.]